MFITIEDDTEIGQSDCLAQIRECFRRATLGANLLRCNRHIERDPVSLSLPEHAVCNFNERECPTPIADESEYRTDS